MSEGTERMPQTYDVVIATDPRLRGGGNKSVATEVRAQAAMGYTTGVYPVYGASRAADPIDASVRELVDEGLADLLFPGQPVQARLLLGRGPALFSQPQPARPRIDADVQLFVINAVHRSPALSKMYYDPAALEVAVTELFPGDWRWTALSPVVRRTVGELAPDLALESWNWPNIIDPEPWTAARDFESAELRIGRHGRDHLSKWPGTAEEIEAAYPTDGRYGVALMGGVMAAARVLGRTPAAWDVYAFDEIPVPHFLRHLHLFSYFHHPDLLEAFGRTTLEALASGLPCVLPEYMEETFGPGPVYCDGPLAAAHAYELLNAERHRLRSLSEASTELVHDRFSPSEHHRRVEELIGRPRSAPHRIVNVSPPSPGSPAEAPPVVLFFTDNGHGLGHITRLMAVARRAAGRFFPVFLTMSEGYPLLHDFGFPVEYTPSYRKLRVDRDEWQGMFASRLATMMQRLQPRAVVVDHVAPVSRLAELRASTKGVEFIWSRRGLWREGLNAPRLDWRSSFDAVVEPGDLAGPIDLGLTATHRSGVLPVGPVTMLSRDELEDRAEARQALGLPAVGRAVLIQLSDSDSGKLGRMIARVRHIVRRASARERISLFAPAHVLHRGELPTVDGVTMRPVYPMARYLLAFDGVVSTAGYNSFHEVVASGVPAVFVARDTFSLDDQARRAAAAELSGRAFWTESVYGDEFEVAVRKMLRATEPQTAARVTDVLGRMEGAREFADIIAERVAARGRTRFSVVPGAKLDRGIDRTVQRMRSGSVLPTRVVEGAKRVLVIALDHDTEELTRLASEVAQIQNSRLNFKPIFLIRGVFPFGLDAWEFQFETLMTDAEWSRLGLAPSYPDYVRGRIVEMRRLFKPDATITPGPQEPVNSWLLP